MVPANLPEVLSRLGYDPVNLFDKSGAGPNLVHDHVTAAGHRCEAEDGVEPVVLAHHAIVALVGKPCRPPASGFPDLNGRRRSGPTDADAAMIKPGTTRRRV